MFQESTVFLGIIQILLVVMGIYLQMYVVVETLLHCSCRAKWMCPLNILYFPCLCSLATPSFSLSTSDSVWDCNLLPHLATFLWYTYSVWKGFIISIFTYRCPKQHSSTRITMLWRTFSCFTGSSFAWKIVPILIEAYKRWLKYSWAWQNSVTDNYSI